MNIPEAIERIEIFLSDVSEGAPELLDDALKLGVEALKRETECRENAPREEWLLLPGETEN